MVVKSNRGRRRYILFKISPGYDKESLIHSANRTCNRGDGLYIIQCQANMAIIRCSPKTIDHTIELMSYVDSNSKSIITSGTLKTIRGAYPEMKANPKR